MQKLTNNIDLLRRTGLRVLMAILGTLAALVTLLLGGCGEPPASSTPYAPTGSTYKLMTRVMEPAADKVWGSAGAIITETEEIDLQPTTDEGWDLVINAATVVAESGNLLMMPGYAADDEAWQVYSQGMTQAALKARTAAENQDADALFDAGGEIYNVCRACHNRYIVAERMTDG